MAGNKVVNSVKARYLEKVSATEYEEKFFTTVVEQIKAEGGIAGQGAGASLAAILNSLFALASKAGVTSVKVGTGNKETGDVIVNLDKLGTVAITQAQVNQIATNTTLANNAQTKANDAYSLAQGRVRGIAYDTEADMNTALKKMAKGDLKIGDNIFIKATGTPDYWVSAILDNNEGTRGYYELSPLETQTIDLTGYATVAALKAVETKADNAKSAADTAQRTANTAKTNADTANSEIGKLKAGTTPAGKANRLATARTIALSGDATGSANFDGTANATISAVLKNTGVTAGTYSAVQVDAKGRVLKGSQMIVFAPNIDDASLNNLAIGGIAVVDTEASQS